MCVLQSETGLFWGWWKIVSIWSRGILKFGLGRDVPPQNLKVDPYKYQFFKEKWPIHIPIVPILCQILSKITQFSKTFLKLSHFWLKFGNILKNRPIHIPNFTFYKGSFIYQEADFSTRVGATSPRVFCTEYPPGGCLVRSAEHIWVEMGGAIKYAVFWFSLGRGKRYWVITGWGWGKWAVTLKAHSLISYRGRSPWPAGLEASHWLLKAEVNEQ